MLLFAPPTPATALLSIPRLAVAATTGLPRRRAAAARAMAEPGRPISYLTAAQSAAIDARLMGEEYGFSLPQLMELAGLAVALAIAKHYPDPAPHHITALCGPGNNGGDALVAARHLHHFGYRVSLIYPKRPSRAPFPGLLAQLRALGLEPLSAPPLPPSTTIVLDAIFGFSFRPAAPPAPAVRPPFDALLAAMNAATAAQLVALDVPSAWDVDAPAAAPPPGARAPDVVVSLTAPKRCVQGLGPAVAMYLGGRFVPRKLEREMGIVIPPYEGAELVTRFN